VRHELVVVVNGAVVGHLAEEGGKYLLRYDDEWRAAEASFPLSLSLPLNRAEHGDQPVRAYLGNLLPDNSAILSGWGRRYQVSANDPLALLSHVGEECPGALQLLSPRRAEQILSVPAAPDAVAWLSDGSGPGRFLTRQTGRMIDTAGDLSSER
jgi:serine/threonine-protein kinase HipA